MFEEMFETPRHSSQGRPRNVEPKLVPAIQQTPRNGSFSLQSDPPADTGHAFPVLQPSPGDNVFSTPGNRPALTGTYSLLRRKRVSRAVYMASTHQSRQNYYPLYPGIERRNQVRASRHQLTSQAADLQKQATALARSQAKLIREREHHVECARNLETRIQEAETAHRALDLRHSQVSDSLDRLAQGQVDFNPQDMIESVIPEDHGERIRDASVDVRHQLTDTFQVEHKAFTTFNRPRRIAMLKAPQYFEFQARHAVQRVAPRARLDNRYAAVSARIQHLQVGRTLRERRHVAPGARLLDTRHASVSVRAQHPGGTLRQEHHGATASTRLKGTAKAVNRSSKTAC